MKYIFIPSLSLAFEYNGEYHYKLVPIHHSGHIQERDTKKRAWCQAHGITLITIPYWWDKKPESVATTLHMIRPDIGIPTSLLTGYPIPSEISHQLVYHLPKVINLSDPFDTVGWYVF